MASKLLRSRIMKPKDQTRTDNVLALEKAAAWAWYQHGSGSEAKTTMRESHLSRTHQRDHRPSRYKLEAMRMASPSSPSSSQVNKEEEGSSCPVQDINKLLPLLDAYEVRSILTRLDSLIIEFSDDKLDNAFGSANNGGQRMKKKKVGKGIWDRRRVRVICSPSKEDVVDGRRHSKEGHQIQLSASKCSMPRANNNGGRVM